MSQPEGAPELRNTAPSGMAPPRASAAARLPWKVPATGKTVFRLGTPLFLWWVWVAFAIFNIIDVVIPDHDYFSFELTAGLLAVTAVVYACTLRPRVVADDDAIYVCNPYRDHIVRWGSVSGVYLGDSVEITCARPSPKKDKIVYCWALYSGRGSRVRSELRARRQQARLTRQQATNFANSRRPDAVQLIADDLGRRSTDAKQRGAPEAILESRWARLPLIYLLVPAAVLVGLILAR
jgi:hypothetical protein